LRGVEVRREWQHIDLLIICQEPRLLVVIENKIRSEEGPDQLRRYERVVRERYPDARPLYVYLTLEGDEPSQEMWMPYTHADIHRVLTRVRGASGNAIGDDVLVFLDHYLSLLGTRFMNDEKIGELCQRIYKNHRQALDLIWERMGSPASGVLAEAQSVLEEDPRWSVDTRPGVIDFVPRGWLDWLPKLGDRGDPQWWIYGRLGARDGKLKYGLSMAPMKDSARRAEILKRLIEERPGFEFKLPRSHAREMKNNYCRIAPTERIFDGDEDGDYDPEEVRAAVKRTLDSLYPKLQKLEPVLRQLCNVAGAAS
jgi:hypothetical protein